MILSFSFHLYKMKITIICPIPDCSRSFKTDFRKKPRKGNIVVFAKYCAEFWTIVLYADVIIQAGMKIEMYFFSIATHPLRLPCFWRKILCHMFFDTHSIHCLNKRHANKFFIICFIGKRGFRCFLSDFI